MDPDTGISTTITGASLSPVSPPTSTGTDTRPITWIFNWKTLSRQYCLASNNLYSLPKNYPDPQNEPPSFLSVLSAFLLWISCIFLPRLTPPEIHESSFWWKKSRLNKLFLLNSKVPCTLIEISPKKINTASVLSHGFTSLLGNFTFASLSLSLRPWKLLKTHSKNLRIHQKLRKYPLPVWNSQIRMHPSLDSE